MSSVYRIGEFAEKIGRSASTVRRWESEGRISARRSPSGQRSFTDADIHGVLTPGFDRTDRQTAVYCRVPSAGQRTDLAYLEHEATVAGCEVLVANQESLSPEGEMVQDLLAIAHTFSCRLHGLGWYEKSLKLNDLTGGPV